MTLVMVARVTFAAVRSRPELIIRRVTSVHIESTFRELTGRAEITIARNVAYFDKYKVKEVFQGGDPVKIELGYNGNFITEFTGYVASVSASVPIVIKCEDEMYKLKRIPVNFSSPGITLENLLKTVCPGYDVNALEGVQLGGVRFAKTSVGKVLQKLSEDPFKIYSYMRGKQLVSGKYYADVDGVTHRFDLERNCVSNALNYRNRENVLVKINGTSVLANGKKVTFDFGEDGGDQLNLTYYNIELKAELERLVRHDYEKRKQDGFDGTFTAFGIPSVKHGDKANITSEIYPDRAGIYYIESVVKDFTDDAKYRQIIKLGDKAA